MDMKQISGRSALDFAKEFDYIREAGTDGEHRAAERICSRLRELGLTPELSVFPVRRVYVKNAVFRVTSPYCKEYPAAGVRGSASVPQGLRAKFLYGEDGDAVSLAGARGRIVLLSRKPSPAEYADLTASGMAAVLCACGAPTDTGEDRIPQSGKLYGSGMPIPVLMLHCLDAAELVERGAQEAELVLELEEETADSANVSVTIPGTRKPQEIIAMTAHYDSVPEGPGAYDDLAGAAIVYEVCRYYAENPPEHTMEFTFMGAEELGCLGSIHHLCSRAAQLDRYRIDLNVDLAGQTVGGTVLGITAGTGIMQEADACIRRLGIGAKLRQAVWSGDANTFAACAIPAITLDRDGFGMHTRHDTLALLSAWALERDARLLAGLAEHFDTLPSLPNGSQVPQEMAAALAAQYTGKL